MEFSACSIDDDDSYYRLVVQDLVDHQISSDYQVSTKYLKQIDPIGFSFFAKKNVHWLQKVARGEYKSFVSKARVLDIMRTFWRANRLDFTQDNELYHQPAMVRGRTRQLMAAAERMIRYRFNKDRLNHDTSFVDLKYRLMDQRPEWMDGNGERTYDQHVTGWTDIADEHLIEQLEQQEY